MTYKYNVSKPKFYNEVLFREYLDDILASNVWSNRGKYVRQLEEMYNNRVSVVPNATIGLELCLRRHLKDNPNKFVFCPNYTFVATATAIIRSGGIPIFVDCNQDYCMDMSDLLDKSTKYPSCNFAVLVHTFGNLCDLEELRAVGVSYMVDAAHCNGIPDELLAGDGYEIVRSFHPTKLAGGFELGLVRAINNYVYNTQSNFGLSPYTLTDIDLDLDDGTNAKASEVAAAAALAQLKYIEEIKSHYKSIYEAYQRYLPERFYLPSPNSKDSNYSYVPVMECWYRNVPEIIEKLKEVGIEARRYFKPLDSIPLLQSKSANGHYNSCPMSHTLYEITLCLPTGLHIDEDAVIEICEALSKC